MSFPMINYKFTNTESRDHLQDISENKLNTLEKFIGDAPAICELEFERITNHHQSGEIHRAEVNLEINGKLYRAEATADSFEKAIDDVRNELYNELQSQQGKRETLMKRVLLYTFYHP